MRASGGGGCHNREGGKAGEKEAHRGRLFSI
jgi:hypothetical protein